MFRHAINNFFQICCCSSTFLSLTALSGDFVGEKVSLAYKDGQLS